MRQSCYSAIPIASLLELKCQRVKGEQGGCEVQVLILVEGSRAAGIHAD